MANIVGTVSYASTGVKSINLGFQPSYYEVHVGGPFGSSDTFHHSSDGWVDENGNEFCVSKYQDASDGKTINHNNKCFSLMNSSGLIITEGSHDSFHANGINLDVTTANSAFQLIIVART